MKKACILLSVISTAAFCFTAYGSTSETTEIFVKNNHHYITKTYTLENDEDITELTDSRFDLNGYTYHQIDIISNPIIEILEKDVFETAKIVVPSENDSLVLEKLGETKEYTDEDGYVGTLKLNTENITYSIKEYTTKTYTKTDEKMYYNLPSMDTSQIAKSIWSGGVQLSLNDIQWISDNNSTSADTTVGNNQHAKAFYSGTYNVNVPSSYVAEVTFNGTVKKEISERTEYKVTYLGEEILPVPTENNDGIPILIVVGTIIFVLLFIGNCIYLFKKLHKRPHTEEIEKDEEDESDVES